jgi:hypothetical protein
MNGPPRWRRSTRTVATGRRQRGRGAAAAHCRRILLDHKLGYHR